MPEGPNLREVGSRVELLVSELRSVSDPSVRDKAEELVRLLVELYGAGLDRILEIIAIEEASGEELIYRLADDEFVASLLMLHDLHPLRVEERVRQALEKVRPYLGSHAGGVDLLGIDDEGVVHLALQGSCDGCKSSAITVKLAIERAIEEAAPEVTAVQVEGLTEPGPAGPELLQIQPRPPGTAPAPGPGPTWTAVEGLADLTVGEMRAAQVSGLGIAICRLDGGLYAYRDACSSCGSSVVGGQLSGELLTCPSCHRQYNLRLAGRSVEDGSVEHGSVDDGAVHLDPLPLLAENGKVKVAVATVGSPS